MAYHHLDPDAIEPAQDYPCDRRSLSVPAGLTALNVAIYELAPGEDLARTYHSHEIREEAFYVLSGTLHVETPDEEYVVEADEAFVVEPTNPIRPYNPEDAEGDVRVLGTGSPKTDPARPFRPDR
jgi:mannose-6-phosphate isomerase-like protein (cupin superfamily)